MPDDGDISTFDELAVVMHEYFQSYVNAGFTRFEALVLVLNMQNQSMSSTDSQEGP